MRNNNLIFNSLYLRRDSGERWARAHSFPGKVRRGLEAEPGPRGTHLGRSFSGPPGRPARPVSGSGRTGSYNPNRAKRDETVDAAEQKEARSPAPLFCLCCGGCGEPRVRCSLVTARGRPCLSAWLWGS